MKAVLVTGAAGFIGRAACAALESRGWRVVRGTRENGSLERGWPLEGVDAVVHLAGVAHELDGQNAEAVYQAMNCQATEHLARAAAQAGAKRFVFMSSIKVNGERTPIDRPFTPKDAPHPEDRYARSKWQAEQALRQVASETGLEIAVIRPPLVYGPGAKANFSRLLRLVKTGLPLPFASIENRRSLLYVGNLTDLVEICLTHPAAVGATLMPSDEESLSTPQIVSEIAAAMRRRARLFPFPPRLLPSKLVESLLIDSDSTRSAIGWRPRFSVHVGLRNTVDQLTG